MQLGHLVTGPGSFSPDQDARAKDGANLTAVRDIIAEATESVPADGLPASGDSARRPAASDVIEQCTTVQRGGSMLEQQDLPSLTRHRVLLDLDDEQSSPEAKGPMSLQTFLPPSSRAGQEQDLSESSTKSFQLTHAPDPSTGADTADVASILVHTSNPLATEPVVNLRCGICHKLGFSEAQVAVHEKMCASKKGRSAQLKKSSIVDQSGNGGDVYKSIRSTEGSDGRPVVLVNGQWQARYWCTVQQQVLKSVH